MNVYNLENIRKGDKAMQKRSKKQQNTLINSVLKAVVGMFFCRTRTFAQSSIASSISLQSSLSSG